MRNKTKKTLLPVLIGLASFLLAGANPILAGASKTSHPVVFAHGLGGMDDIFGFFYFGDDYGTFVGDPCDTFLEVSCNAQIHSAQKAHAAQVAPFQTSEVRGTQLANEIEGYLATVGASSVNIIGHSQGGIDARKAAHVLRARTGRQVVKVLLTVSSPHRGSPVAKSLLDLGSATQVVNFLATVYGNIVYGAGNDGYGAAMQLVYDDYSATDGVQTGMRIFNEHYPNSPAVAKRYASVVTAQRGAGLNPALGLLKALIDIDGDGACAGDCDNDGAGGKGDGTRGDLDDDGLVGINSQQNGYRLQYTECFLCFDSFNTYGALGYAGDANAPTNSQMQSAAAIIEQDHADVIGVGPDTFDEKEFYAAALHYIAYYD
ncbi:MAG: acetyltransferase [Leptospirales bacterium]|jgi:triacylglycerol lipase